MGRHGVHPALDRIPGAGAIRGRAAGGAAISSAVFLGLAPSAAGFVLWAYAMARLDVGRVTLGLYLVPAAAIGISLVWLGQAPARWS